MFRIIRAITFVGIAVSFCQVLLPSLGMPFDFWATVGGGLVGAVVGEAFMG